MSSVLKEGRVFTVCYKRKVVVLNPSIFGSSHCRS